MRFARPQLVLGSLSRLVILPHESPREASITLSFLELCEADPTTLRALTSSPIASDKRSSFNREGLLSRLAGPALQRARSAT